MTRKYFAYPYIIWMVLFIVVPLLLIVYYAFTAEAAGTISFSLQNISAFFSQSNLTVFGKSIWLAFLCTVICLMLGYPVAYILASQRRSSKTLMVWFVLPMWMNFLLRTYAWLIILDTNGIINKFINLLGFESVQLLYNNGAVLLGMIYNFLPFMILPIYTALTKIPRNLYEAAEDLGASSSIKFFKITVPLSFPGIVSGITMVFIPSITTFSISRLLGGSQTMLFGDLIENQFMFMQDWHAGSAISFVMMIMMLISLYILSRYEKAGESAGGLW